MSHVRRFFWFHVRLVGVSKTLRGAASARHCANVILYFFLSAQLGSYLPRLCLSFVIEYTLVLPSALSVLAKLSVHHACKWIVLQHISARQCALWKWIHFRFIESGFFSIRHRHICQPREIMLFIGNPKGRSKMISNVSPHVSGVVSSGLKYTRTLQGPKLYTVDVHVWTEGVDLLLADVVVCCMFFLLS